MRNSHALLVAAVVLALASGPQPARAGGQTLASGTQVSYYEVVRAKSPVVIDGSLDEYAWQTAEQINGFARILNYYDPVQKPTRAKMLWDDENLYLGFACEDPDMWALYQQEDDALWEEEVVEAFIDPDGDGKDYLELEISPTNTVVDLRIFSVVDEFRSSKDWDIKGLKSAVRAVGTVNDSAATDLGWTVEIAIPWSAMVDSIGGARKPVVDDQWRLNLYRIDRGAGRAAKSRLDALSAQARPLQAQQRDLLASQQVKSRDQLKGKARQRYDQLEAQLEPLTAQLEPVSKNYEEQTEYTAWSETFQRGFHDPSRFGVIRFVP